MPIISTKGQLMPESPIRKLVPFAEKAYKANKKVYHLNIGQPDIKSPKQAMEAVAAHSLEVLAYTRSEGSETYRMKIAAYYQGKNIPVNHNELIVTTGGSEALLFAMGSIADTGDEIIIPEPFYANYNGFAIASGVKIVPVISKIEDNFALPNISEFEKLITPKTKAILICNPGNPTGYLYSKQEIQTLAAIVKKHDLFLVADEVYREFTYDNVRHYSILEEPGMEDYAIIIDSVSKRYSMCGARIGCLVSKNKMVLNYKERRDVLIEKLEEIPGVKVGYPKGAFYCIVQLPIKNSDAFAQWLLEEFDVDGETIMVAPAAGFYSTPGVGQNQIRIAYVLNKESLIKAVNILKQALVAYKE